MAPIVSKIAFKSPNTSPPSAASFFTAREPRKTAIRRDYNYMQNGGEESVLTSDKIPSINKEENRDTIIVEVPPGHTDYPSNNNIADEDIKLLAPIFNNTTMLEQEKLEAVKR